MPTANNQHTGEIVRRALAKMTPERRRVALVRYDEQFARWQALHDPLYKALVSLHRELRTPYKDVPLQPQELQSPNASG